MPSMGNVKYQDFDDVWNGSTWHKLRHSMVTGEDLPEPCVNCYRRVRHCAASGV